ncbi:MAG: transposase [Pseudomonadota bacterium]|nr:transposase [Pseudomonadota bacterium]
MTLQLLYTIRSERQFVERLEFDILLRGFVGLSIDERVLDASTFSKNRDAQRRDRPATAVALSELKRLMSAEHFSVDGTLLKA